MSPTVDGAPRPSEEEPFAFAAPCVVASVSSTGAPGWPVAVEVGVGVGGGPDVAGSSVRSLDAGLPLRTAPCSGMVSQTNAAGGDGDEPATVATAAGVLVVVMNFLMFIPSEIGGVWW